MNPTAAVYDPACAGDHRPEVKYRKSGGNGMDIRRERISAGDYIDFLKRTDLGSQYPKERFGERIEALVRHAAVSIIARNEEGQVIGVCFGITDFAYWLFITDLGIDRRYAGQGLGRQLVRRAHEEAGGEKNIVMYTCVNENAIGFYEKLGMSMSTDVMELNNTQWTPFTVD